MCVDRFSITYDSFTKGFFFEMAWTSKLTTILGFYHAGFDYICIRSCSGLEVWPRLWLCNFAEEFLEFLFYYFQPLTLNLFKILGKL